MNLYNTSKFPEKRERETDRQTDRDRERERDRRGQKKERETDSVFSTHNIYTAER